MKLPELRSLLESSRVALLRHDFVEQTVRGEIVMLRQRGPFLDVVGLWLARSGEFVHFTANCWTPSVLEEPATFATEVDLAYVARTAGGDVSVHGIGDPGFWSVQTAELAAQTAEGIERAVVDVVLPFLAGIVDGESFASACAEVNRGWWRTVRQARREFIRTAIDRALEDRASIGPFRFV